VKRYEDDSSLSLFAAFQAARTRLKILRSVTKHRPRSTIATTAPPTGPSTANIAAMRSTATTSSQKPTNKNSPKNSPWTKDSLIVSPRPQMPPLRRYDVPLGFSSSAHVTITAPCWAYVWHCAYPLNIDRLHALSRRCGPAAASYASLSRHAMSASSLWSSKQASASRNISSSERSCFLAASILRLSRVSHSLVSFEMVMVVLSCVCVICHSSCAALAINASTCDTVYLYLVAGCPKGLLQKNAEVRRGWAT